MTVYLDHAATTFRKPESVCRAVAEAVRNCNVNAGRGSYGLAREAEQRIEETRALVRELVGAPLSAEVVFSASATLALNAVIGGMDWKERDVVYVSPYEHNAVMRTLHAYQQKYGFRIEELPLEENWRVDVPGCAYLFARTPPDYLFLNGVSNVTGYVLPVEELCREAKKYDCITVVDGAQMLGTLPVTVRDWNVDFLVFAGHKALCGPFGIGGYLNLGGSRLQKVFSGGTGSDSLNLNMPEGTAGYEPGSPNITAVLGLRAALLEIQDRELQRKHWERERQLIGRLIDSLAELPRLHLYTAPDRDTQAGILSVNLENYRAQEVGQILDEEFGIAVRTGYHCAPLIHRYLGDESFGGTVRISIGRFTQEQELQRALQALRNLAEE